MAKKKSTTKQSSSEQPEEHRVFSHLMYLLFLIAAAMAAYYTFNMFTAVTTENSMPIKALVLLAWAYTFKTLAHRIHG